MPGKIPVVEKDFRVFRRIGGIGRNLCPLCSVDLFRLFSAVYDDCKPYESSLYKLIAFGLGTVYIVQVFLTVGGVTKFIPSTGVTLPLMSYGGSSVFSTFILFGVMQGLYILKQE